MSTWLNKLLKCLCPDFLICWTETIASRSVVQVSIKQWYTEDPCHGNTLGIQQSHPQTAPTSLYLLSPLTYLTCWQSAAFKILLTSDLSFSPHPDKEDVKMTIVNPSVTPVVWECLPLPSTHILLLRTAAYTEKRPQRDCSLQQTMTRKSPRASCLCASLATAASFAKLLDFETMSCAILVRWKFAAIG